MSVSYSLRADAFARLRRNRMAVAGLLLLVFLALACLIGPELSSYSFREQNLSNANAPARLAHWAGTDELGRDLLTRTLVGGRISFAVALAATLVSLVIGVTYGAVSGYLGGRVDDLMMRLVDVLMALPFTLFVILLITVFERNLLLLFAAIGAVEWLTMARIVRVQVLALR